MELRRFTQAIARLSGSDIHRLARDIQSRHDTAAADLMWWHSTITIERALKASGRTREASMAAMDAARAVQRVAAERGMDLPDGEVTSVARAAAEIARGLCAHGIAAELEVDRLLALWVPVLDGAVLA